VDRCAREALLYCKDNVASVRSLFVKTLGIETSWVFTRENVAQRLGFD
jgi:hypothetical protein